jgi:hypothetical protein
VTKIDEALSPPIRWKRIEPGWYELLGTGIRVANMRGTEVRWTGADTPCWVVTVNGRIGATHFTKRGAQEEAVLLASNGAR